MIDKKRSVGMANKIAVIGICLHLILFVCIYLFGFFKPESWMTFLLLTIFYLPLILILNLLGYDPRGFMAFLYFVISGAILYGLVFWLIGILISKIKK